MSTRGFQFKFAPKTTPQQLGSWLYQNYDVTLSQRRLKHLTEHGWIGSRWGVIPWGFFQPLTTASRVLYEDDECLGVYKPPFVSVVGPHSTRTLFGFWQNRFPTLAAVHRLDFETSGLVMFAKTPRAKKLLDDAFKHREVQKGYVAVVQGQPTQSQWVVKTALQPKSGQMIQATKFTPRKLVLSAETKFRCLKTWKTESGKLLTWVEAKPKTGRRHQIRAHLYWSGHPVVGETLYGGLDSLRHLGIRLQLHAKQLSVTMGKHPVQVDCPVPPDMLGVDMLGLNHD